MAFDLWATLFDEPAAPTDVDVVRVFRRAMATQFEIMLPVGTPLAQAAAVAALDLIDELEAQLTVYRADSEISQLNARAANELVRVEPHLWTLLERAALLSKETHGAFDVATGAIIKAWGFYQRQGRVPTPSEQAAAMQRSGTRFVVLDHQTYGVRYLRTGLEINLGAMGKGYALDRAAELLRRDWGITSALLHGGGSSVYAIGTPPGQPRGWPIALKHPWAANTYLGTVYLADRGLGTSAATFQHFKYNGRTLGHLLDPRTGWPAESVQQVSVIAASAADADALSTACFVLGADATRQWCFTHPDSSVILLPSDRAQPLVWNATPAQVKLS